MFEENVFDTFLHICTYFCAYFCKYSTKNFGSQENIEPSTGASTIQNMDIDQAEEKYCFSSVISSPATVALVKVLIAPVIMALTATRDTSALRPGEI
jgi:hypothetical protein